ncbi:acyltransferase family protein [Serratia rhizosphaerae]|uniref:acyltransferase family protein n=1 Tax=unclassified Serratia (in: enterobacteria) TaxID=2647522 RepID=UPI001EF0A3A6|nr:MULTISPECIES: acyltransferase family protein [unclassified Serratia (in: enterobacteria)]
MLTICLYFRIILLTLGGIVKYRADIDGLRALAVLPVIAYHMGFPGIPGGFTGVDIFFVISGYLISGIIFQEYIKGDFSYVDFYKRRSLRILPPLFVVLLVTLVIGYHILLPVQVAELGKSALATTLFSSNFFFFSQTGYFDGPAELKPLLHTWSLAVEEQFYILFPIILFTALKFFRNRTTMMIVLIIIGSFMLSLLGLKFQPSMTFYMLPTRAWELALGALLAVGGLEQAAFLKKSATRHALSLLGLALIVFGFLWLDTTKKFPSYNALYPCVGAFLIIISGRDAIINKILAIKPIVYIGMISYCLYLWHWPIIVYTNILFDGALWQKSLLVLSSTFILAIASRYLIEIPFRYKLKNVPSKRIVTASAASVVLAASLTSIIGYWQYDNGSFSDNSLKIADYINYRTTDEYNYQYRFGECFINGEVGATGNYNKEHCLKLSDTKKNVVLIGDSHGAHLWRAISLAAGENVNLMQATASGCKPVTEQKFSNRCTAIMDYVYKDLIINNKIDGVIVSARWNEHDKPALINTINYLKQHTKNFYILGPTVEYKGPLPELLAYQENGDPALASRSVVKSRKLMDSELKALSTSMKTNYISVYDLICPGDRCLEMTTSGQPAAFDYGHFTLSGANYVAKGIVAQLNSNHFFFQ